MDMFGLIAIALGLAGVALGCLGVWKALEAKARADESFQIAQTSQKVADAASRGASDATAAVRARQPRSREVARESQTPAVDDSTVHAEVAPQHNMSALIDAAQGDKIANLVVRSGSATDQDLPTNQGTGSGLIGIFLFNEGPAVAHDMQLHATFPNGTRRSSETHRTLSVHKELTLFAQVVPPDFGADDPLHVLYTIAYRDGNGEQELERDIRVEGGWKGPWKTFIEAN